MKTRIELNAISTHLENRYKQVNNPLSVSNWLCCPEIITNNTDVLLTTMKENKLWKKVTVKKRKAFYPIFKAYER